MKSKEIILYTKHCAKCMYKEQLERLQKYAIEKGKSVKVKRTAYRPSWHKKAAELYGSEDYNIFFVEGAKIVDLLSWQSKTKKKPVSSGKKKGKNGVQRLPKTKRSNRENSLDLEENKTVQ